jgi:hypothetical protein
MNAVEQVLVVYKLYTAITATTTTITAIKDYFNKEEKVVEDEEWTLLAPKGGLN